jgi:hypothetical protein
MSLIVDINPVPWEILDLVRARILKNRANRQKRQPEKGKDLRRVMRVDNGILAKQRWEEPSFIGGSEKTPYIAFVKSQGIGRVLNTYNEAPTIDQSWYWHKSKINGFLIENGIYQMEKINSINKLGEFQVMTSDSDVPEGFLFIWSENTNDQNEVISLSSYIPQYVSWTNLLGSFYGNITSRVPARWKIFALKGQQPNPGELAYMSFIRSPNSYLGYIYWGFVEDIRTEANTAINAIANPNFVWDRRGIVKKDNKTMFRFTWDANTIFAGVVQGINLEIEFSDD